MSAVTTSTLTLFPRSLYLVLREMSDGHEKDESRRSRSSCLSPRLLDEVGWSGRKQSSRSSSEGVKYRNRKGRRISTAASP